MEEALSHESQGPRQPAVGDLPTHGEPPGDDAPHMELLVSMLGHDLRQPLTTLSVCCGKLARDPQLSDAHVRLAQRMARSIDRMDRMIGHLLDATRIRFDGASARRVQTSLGEVCREVIDEIEARATERRFALEIRGEDTGLWDDEQLKRVVANLVDNAVRHGAPGTPIDLRLWSETGAVCLEVKNAGPIADDVRDRLFRPFATEARRARQRTGLGLGLYIARELVLAHGGEIRASSSGAETSFWVTLPRAPASGRADAPDLI